LDTNGGGLAVFIEVPVWFAGEWAKPWLVGVYVYIDKEDYHKNGVYKITFNTLFVIGTVYN
jgi:hypothetical protein